jgi:hypothetical protein
MAESENTTNVMVVCFWHDGQVEATAIVSDPDAALKAAKDMLADRDGLYVGDQLTVDGTVRPTLTERGLA